MSNTTKMNTNQQMVVKLGEYGDISIGHKTQMGSADQILGIGNEIRESKGLHPKKLDTYLQLSETWEKIIEVYNNEGITNCNSTTKWSSSAIAEKLSFNTINDLPKYDNGKIAYPDIIKTRKLDSIVKKVTRGKFENRGTWLKLVMLLDLAEWLDVSLWYEVHNTFINGKLLEYRDDGGGTFKQLVKLYPKLIGCKTNLRTTIAVMINSQVNDGKFDAGWNDEKKDTMKQKHRDEIQSKLINYIEMGFITTIDQLKSTIVIL